MKIENIYIYICIQISKYIILKFGKIRITYIMTQLLKDYREILYLC